MGVHKANWRNEKGVYVPLARRSCLCKEYIYTMEKLIN